MSYKEFKVDLTPAQGKKVLEGKAVRLTHAQLNHGKSHYFHIENYKKLVRAYEAGRGTTLNMSHGAVLKTHQSGLDGSGFWGDLWKGVKASAKSVGGFLKDNWKPIASGVMDTGVNIFPEAAPMRKLVKTVSGLGMKKQRRIAASGSFRLN